MADAQSLGVIHGSEMSIEGDDEGTRRCCDAMAARGVESSDGSVRIAKGALLRSPSQPFPTRGDLKVEIEVGSEQPSRPSSRRIFAGVRFEAAATAD